MSFCSMKDIAACGEYGQVGIRNKILSSHKNSFVGSTTSLSIPTTAQLFHMEVVIERLGQENSSNIALQQV